MNMPNHCTHDAAAHRIVYDVPRYSQGFTYLCWAYCEIMVSQWKYSAHFISQSEADAKARTLAYNTSEGERIKFNHRGIPSCGSTHKIPETCEGLYEVLLAEGPLYANFKGSDGSYHTVVLRGVDCRTKTVYYNDPGMLRLREECSFSDFMHNGDHMGLRNSYRCVTYNVPVDRE